jgi:hypothetical protein
MLAFPRTVLAQTETILLYLHSWHHGKVACAALGPGCPAFGMLVNRYLLVHVPIRTFTDQVSGGEAQVALAAVFYILICWAVWVLSRDLWRGGSLRAVETKISISIFDSSWAEPAKADMKAFGTEITA